MSFGGKKEKIPARTIGRRGCGCLFLLYWSFPRVPEGNGNRRRLRSPSGRLRLRLPCYNGKDGAWGTDDGSARGHSVQLSPTQSRERVKGGDFVPFHSPLQGAGAAPLLGSRGKAPWVFQRPCHPNGGGGNSGKSGQVGAGLPHASHRVM